MLVLAITHLGTISVYHIIALQSINPAEAFAKTSSINPMRQQRAHFYTGVINLYNALCEAFIPTASGGRKGFASRCSVQDGFAFLRRFRGYLFYSRKFARILEKGLSTFSQSTRAFFIHGRYPRPNLLLRRAQNAKNHGRAARGKSKNRKGA